MYSCAKCREPFLSTDEIRDLDKRIPELFRPAILPYLSRMVIFRCPGENCTGLLTVVFREKRGVTAPAARARIP